MLLRLYLRRTFVQVSLSGPHAHGRGMPKATLTAPIWLFSFKNIQKTPCLSVGYHFSLNTYSNYI